MRRGWLYPLRPYTTHVNTFHVPTVESTLLHSFIKGTEFLRTAPLVFQDTLEGTMRYLTLGGHLCEPEGATLSDFMRLEPTPRIGLQSIGWAIDPKHLIWMPKQLNRLADRPALEYVVLLALFFRVNGASSLLHKMRGLFHGGQLPKTDVLPEKIDLFIQTHFPLARVLDSMPDPCDGAIAEAKLCVPLLAKPLGATQYREDRDSIRIEKRIIKLEQTPVEVLAAAAKVSGQKKRVISVDFQQPVDEVLARLAHSIRCELDDEALVALYVREHEDDAFDFYYPIRMTEGPDQCRAHSWYLACLHMINAAWEEVSAFDEDAKRRLLAKHENDDDDEEESDEEEKKDRQPVTRFLRRAGHSQVDPVKWLNGGFVHSLAIRHAFHRCMGAYVDLFYHALAENKISDETWRSDITSGMPSLLDRFFPYDTACFHWGDLPSLSSVMEDIGLTGVQVVKTKIPFVRMTMKALPVCCQSRDLVKAFLKECRAPGSAGGEGFWRVVRAMFYCTLCGLYPGSERKVDFRSMMKIRYMLFIDRNAFFTALEREIVENKARPKGQKLNKACQLVYVVFREYFIYLATAGNAASDAWLSVVNRHIKWEQFVVNTLKNADEMRRCARIADAPKGNEFLFAINALFRCKDDYPLDVYRYRKKEYVAMLMDKFNSTQDGLNQKHRAEADDIRLMQGLVEQGVLEAKDVVPLHSTRHAQTLFKSDPVSMLVEAKEEGCPEVFGQALDRALKEAYTRYAHLSYEVDPEVKTNIINYLLRTRPADRLRFDMLLDERLGGVSRESVQAIYKTKHVFDTRSSPKSIETYVSNLEIRDFRIFSW